MASYTARNAETVGGTGSGRSLPSADSDNTPRPEVPAQPSSVQPTPAHFQGNGDDGYFTLQPTESYASASISSTHASPTPSIASSSSSRLRDAVLDATRRLSVQLDLISNRPQVLRDLSNASAASVNSTDSNTTVRAPRPGFIGRPIRRQTSHFPNQAYSALQQQHHPTPHLPPTLRTRSLYPSEPVDFTAAVASLHASGVRTADHSPTITPGLFNNAAPKDKVESGPGQGYYPSPYLHWSHRQAPKETHVADVDVDPISGRKIINEYEIIDELGRGTHGKVKLGRNLKTGEYVAIKIVERYSKKRRLGKLGNAEDKVKREVAILKKARHPNIVALLEVIDDPARKKVYIVLERVDLGEIHWRVEGAKEIVLIEGRRYEREARGVFNDFEAEAEEQAILDLARARREKEARHRWRRMRRTKQAAKNGLDVWSIEFGGDTDSDDSDMERASRMSTSTTDLSVDHAAQLERIISRAATPSLPTTAEEPEINTSVRSAAPLLDAPMEESGRGNMALETTLSPESDLEEDEEEIGEPMTRPASRASTARSSRASGDRSHDVRDFARHSRSDNLLTRATDLLDAEMHPELSYAPCMTMQAARAAFRDTLLGLQYLHYQGIIHRDIKPPNLLQTRDHRTKISDFGVSYLGRPIEEDQAENLSESDAQDFDEAKELAKTVGTAAFYAPELCYTDLVTDCPPVGKAIDVWALGITLFCMLFARVPFVDSEYVVMRRIADEDIYVPRKRLRPVESRPKSRPSSHGRHLPPAWTGMRSHTELAYEDLDDDLLDLLHRLLIKDPKQRITLEEVRYHPWVIADISDKAMWLDETDPTQQADGKKIEISKEEIHDAVVPIQLIDRIRSGIKKLGGTLGLGRSSSTRKRAPSAGTVSTASASAGSSSTNITKDGRVGNVRGDESILNALKASREGDHPLAQSVTASPDLSHHPSFLDSNSVAASSREDSAMPIAVHQRPKVPERAQSNMSTTLSVRTVKASDPGFEPLSGSSPPSPVLSASSFDSNASAMSSLTSGTGRLLLGGASLRSSARTKSTAASTAGSRRHRSTSRAPPDSQDTHSHASLAISTASASGQLDPPQALKEPSSASSSTYTSPTSTTPHSVVASPILDRRDRGFMDLFEHGVPHKPYASSLEPQNTASATHSRTPSTQHRLPHLLPNESTDEDFKRANDQLMRRHLLEERERPSSSLSSHTPSSSATPVEQRTCPPSPDDDMYRQRAGLQAVQSGSSNAASNAASLETSPTSRHSSMQPLMTPNSSAEQFGAGQPRPRKTRPSVSADSISPAFNSAFATIHAEPASTALLPSDTTHALPGPAPRNLDDDDDGYHPDNDSHAIDSSPDEADISSTSLDSASSADEYSDSSDDDGGLQMVRRKSLQQGSGRSMSVTNAQIQRYRERRERRETDASRVSASARSVKSSRSGSGSTMMKVRSHGDSEREKEREDDRRGRLLGVAAPPPTPVG